MRVRTPCAASGHVDHLGRNTARPRFKCSSAAWAAFQTVQTYGPIWSPQTQSLPFAAWLLQCGPVESIGGAEPGSAGIFVAVSVGVRRRGTGLVLGTPTMTGGVTSFAIGNNGGAGYTSAPTVSIALPSLSITGTLTSGSTFCTGIASTAGLVPGMFVEGTGNPTTRSRRSRAPPLLL